MGKLIDGQYVTINAVDPRFVRSAKAEANAIKAGSTKEYIESRGGINASGYYGDSFNPDENLSPEEYDAVIQKGLASGLSGGAIGAAINAATQKKVAASRGTTVESIFGGGNVTSAVDTASAAKALADKQAADAAAEEKRRAGQSAYDLLFSEFDRYGLGGLIEPLKGFIQDGLSEAEFTLRLRETDAYKKRFAANAQRIQKGLRAISEAEYIGLEDAYQETMRAYGLPASYYAKGDMGRQEGFEKLIGGGVAPTELEYRIQTAYDRVINANPEVSKALREFYPDISNGDVLAFVLDPENARDVIKRKVTAAEIGGAAIQSGLGYKGDTPESIRARAEELQRAGVTKETAQQGFGVIADGLERGRQLSNIYKQPDYTQQVAETEVFGLTGKTEAKKQRKKLARLETATFGGTSGAAGGALSRERAGQY